MSDQPTSPEGVPEVKPTQHIAPETPPESSVPSVNAVPTANPPTQDQNAPLATLSPIEEAEIAEAPPAPAPEFIEKPAPEKFRPTSTPRPKKSTPVAKPRKEPYTLITIVSGFRALVITFAAALIVATIFMSFTSPDFLSAPVRASLRQVQATAAKISLPPTAVPTPFWANRIGVVAGHSGIATYGRTKGNVDPGALCPDGFTEASVTMKVAQQVVATLQGKGFTVDLLEEFDPQLPGYQAAAFISIHAQPCEDFGYGGFAIAYSPGRSSVHERDIALAECMRENYGALTGLEFQAGNITEDMTNYHAFSLDGKNIAPTTPGIVLELGFIGHDRDILQNHSDKLAQGVVNGLLCFVTGNSPTAMPRPLVPSPSPVIAPTAKP